MQAAESCLVVKSIQVILCLVCIAPLLCRIFRQVTSQLLRHAHLLQHCHPLCCLHPCLSSFGPLLINLPSSRNCCLQVPRGAGSPPVPIMHSPPRPVSVKDQQDWKIPPSISNWKNPKGYTIPLDKRLAADGRGLQETAINDSFAKFTEALYMAESSARQASQSSIPFTCLYSTPPSVMWAAAMGVQRAPNLHLVLATVPIEVCTVLCMGYVPPISASIAKVFTL